MSEWDSADEDENHATGESLAWGIHRHVHQMGIVGWVIWQVVDPFNWGLLKWNLWNTDASRDFAEDIFTKKYHTFAHFTRHIRPGMEIMDMDDAYTLVAYGAKDKEIAVVISNFDTSTREVALQLKDFEICGPTTRWCTNFIGDDTYAECKDMGPEGEQNTLWIVLPPKSIMSFRIESVVRSCVQSQYIWRV